jgi:aldehyde:ferredoxin oxidoreductase
VVCREEFSRMLDEYYTLHGWDEEGIPSKKTLKRLGLSNEN